MTKSFLLPLLLLSLAPAHAVNPPKLCPDFAPALIDKAKWVWMDRNCKFRTRADLDRILAAHDAWYRQHLVFIWNPATDAAHWNEAIRDPGRADLSGADLGNADLTEANLRYSDLTGAFLGSASLAGAHLEQAKMAGAVLWDANLRGADLANADLAGAHLEAADLTGANLFAADLTGAGLTTAHLAGANLFRADLTGAELIDSDLSRSALLETNFTKADLTHATLWYADFEPRILPPINSMARAQGLETLRWSESFNELNYPLQIEDAQRPNSGKPMPPLPSLPQRWTLWLSWRREHRDSKANPDNKPDRWRNDVAFLWNDFVYGLQPQPSPKSPPRSSQAAANASASSQAAGSPAKQPEERSTAAQGKYPLLDLRNALKQAGYSEAELQVNLAYQRHTQSTLAMILYDWTCDYGAAPLRPLVLALLLALLAIPVYWIGFRHRLFGAQLLIVEKQAGAEVEAPLGTPLTRPPWRMTAPIPAPIPAATADAIPDAIPSPSRQTRLRKLLSPLRLDRLSLRLRRLAASLWPRLCWEAGFFKAVVFFSLMSIIDLGFGGFDFGRWVRLLFFREYDLKARGWLRTVSGLQSLAGLGLLALSLLSFFGHPFE